jgi:predicted dehydrogenase
MALLRVGIIGVGIIGKHHLAEYAKIGGVEIVAAADIDTPELNRVADLYNIPNRYRDFRDLLKHEEIEAVDVCVHNNLHAPLTIAALRTGKHVYCEKPMAGAYADALAMRDTAQECGKKLYIQLARLFSKETRIAQRLIDEGHLGKIYHVRSAGFRRRGRPYVDGYATPQFVQKEVSGGGALYDMGVYHISQLLYLLGNPAVERVSGKVYQETDMDAGRRATSGYSVEEMGVGFIRLADGLTMDLIEVWAAHTASQEGSTIYGSQGGLCLEPLRFYSTLGDTPMNATFESDGADWRWHQLDPMLRHYDSPQHHWVAALRGDVELLPCADLALTTALISEGIYLSDRLGREVTANEIQEKTVSTSLPV